MAQATPSVDQMVRQLQGYSLSILNSQSFKKWSDRVQEYWGWGVSVAGLGLGLIWNWQLVLAVSLGLSVMVWVYLSRLGWWKLPKAWNWQQLWSRSNRSMTLAVASGGVATGGSYLAIAIWRESHSWLATGIIIEGGMMLGVLLLLVWHLHRPLEQMEQIEQIGQKDEQATRLGLADLADADPLKRLIAVRLLTQQAASSNLPLSATDLADCFRLMLNRETETVVCSALLDGLRHLNGLSLGETSRGC
ncbi:MAG TPA: hypothetical protein V6C57_12580 [Coleofasciculaceae cyanobacterium]